MGTASTPARSFSARESRRIPGSRAQTILVVEDDAAIRDLLVFLLEGKGYGVLKARHSQEALLFSNEFPGPIRLLLTNVHMPPFGNGCELAHRIRRSRQDVKVLYLSENSDDETVEKEVRSGLAGFLPKPFTPLGLIEAVQAAMATSVAVA